MVKNKRTASNVVNEIKKMIVSDNLERLPGEMSLSEKLGVSRATIREAIRILEYEGITRTLHGSGTFVIKRSGFGISLNVPLEVEFDNPGHILNLLEVRRGLESSAIRLAIRSATDEMLQGVGEALLRLEDMIAKKEPLGEVDSEFHRRVFQVSRNRFLLDVYEAVFASMEVLWQSPLGIDTFGDAGLPLHRTLCERIMARDLVAALRIFNRIIDVDISDVEKASGFDLETLRKKK